MKFNVITRCSRVDNLLEVGVSILENTDSNITWHILFDTTRLKDISADLLWRLNNNNTKLHFISGNGSDYLYPQMSDLAKTFTDGFVVIVDDDNIVHPEFFSEVSKAIEESDGTQRIFVVNQHVGGKDFTGLEVREAKPENMRYQGVDIAQLVFHHSVFNEYDFTGHYAGDGILIDKIFAENPQWFKYIEKELCFYNYLEKPKRAKVPKVLLIDSFDRELKSYIAADYEDSSLETLCLPTDNNIEAVLTTFKPDAILSIGDDWKNFGNLSNQPNYIRDKWITLSEYNEGTGESAYHCAMQAILRNDYSKVISYFTPAYNTGKTLTRTYTSLVNQTNNNWEWVIVNDSTDGGLTLKIAEEIASKDPRVKVYDFREKSGGIIGEAKYRAASLCKGELLAELDHDDYLTSDCTEILLRASEKHPEIGFFYSDSAEVNENWESCTYAPGFAFGYGKYETVKVDGWEYESCISPNINPKTIRHIVGVPNHIRVWRKDVYFSVGGHNRGLSVADDYELIVRTFLATKMMRIPKLCYLQHIHSSNTTDLSRKDIQRRVRTIMYYYNDKIAERFAALGVDDYVYKENKESPLSVESRFDEEENYVNEIFEL